MTKTETVKLLRREFFASAPLLFLAGGLLKASSLSSQAAPKGSELREELNPAEIEIVKKSAMAMDMGNFWGKGYSCAETGLAVALRFMKKPEDLIWVAGGFGGGIGHQDLCGFLTAGIMAIGFHSGALNLEKKEAKALCGQKVNEYWNWWTSTAPLRCADIREGRKDFKVCHRLGSLASVKLEALLKA
jgi:hypothetical protein